MWFDTEGFHCVKPTPERISLAILAVSEQCRRLPDAGDPRDMVFVTRAWPVWFVAFSGSYRWRMCNTITVRGDITCPQDLVGQTEKLSYEVTELEKQILCAEQGGGMRWHIMTTLAWNGKCVNVGEYHGNPNALNTNSLR